MKINKIYISAFGGLKDFTLELNDGLNVIFGNNEDGKSTVAAFIKAMFYGTGRTTKSLAESIRQKYTPWDGSQMGGRIYFTHENKNYCLEKIFRKSDSTDSIVLTDSDSGQPVPTGESVGQQFFGISASAFERSLFIGNGDFVKDGAAASEINTRLSNVTSTGNEDVSCKQIQKNILDTRTKIISKSGRAGSYAENQQTLADLNARFVKADKDAKTKSELNDTAAKKRAEKEILDKRYSELKVIIDREQDIRNRETLTEFLETKRQLDGLNATLTLKDGTIVNEVFAQKVDFLFKKHNAAAKRCEEINQDITQIKDAVNMQNDISPESAKEQIDSLTNDINLLTEKKTVYETDEASLVAKVNELQQKLETVQNKKSAFNPLFLLLAIVLAAVGAVMAFWVSPVVAAISCGIAAILLVLAFVIKPSDTSAVASVQNELAAANNKLAQSKADKNQIQEQINDINSRINKLLPVLNADTAIKQQLNQKTEALNAEQQKAEKDKAELFSLLSSFDTIDSIEKAEALLAEIKEKTDKQKELKNQLRTVSQFLGNIDYDEARSKLDSMQEAPDEKVDFEAVKAEFDDVSKQIDDLKDTLKGITTQLEFSFKNSENPEELKRKIAETQEKLSSEKAFCDSADIAVEVLEESANELRRGYGSELEKQTQAIFSDLTSGKWGSVHISDSLDMSVEQSDVFGTRDSDFLSLGTTHQAYLSLRLAIAKLISKDDTLPIFLDDSLSQYDDTRTEKAIEFLKEFCAYGQGILFTCHNSICDIAKTQGIEIQKPYK